MNYIMCFWILFLTLTFILVYCDMKFFILRDVTQAYKPYSWARVQLAWWTVIVLSSFITLMLLHADGGIPTFHESTLVLLGISAATTATARVIDLSAAPVMGPAEEKPKKSHFIVDILSDEYNINIHRFQTVIFNLVFGIWFISSVLKSFTSAGISEVMPVITTNNLILLGLSSATYAALKTTENKTKEKEKQAEAIAEADDLTEEPAVG